MTFVPAIGFEYRPSRWISRTYIAISSLAIIAIFLSGTPLPLQCILVIAVIVGTRGALRRLPIPISAVGWSNQGGWSLLREDGASDHATLISFRILHSHALLLRFVSSHHGTLTLWLMPDNSDADLRRRLRMRLLMLKSMMMDERTNIELR